MRALPWTEVRRFSARIKDAYGVPSPPRPEEPFETHAFGMPSPEEEPSAPSRRAPQEHGVTKGPSEQG
jgi:hypothetical protein